MNVSNQTFNLLTISSLILIVCAIIVGLNMYHSDKEISDDTIVAEVNQEPITYRELKVRMDDHRSSVYSYSGQGYAYVDDYYLTPLIK